MTSETFWQAAVDIVAAAGFQGDFTLHPVRGGSNNRLFRVEMDGPCALLKAYFKHLGDPRDRLRAEFSFLSFVWENGVRCVPQPFACDPQNGLGLYEFIEGRQLYPNEITTSMVQQAIDFYLDLNRHKRLPSARTLHEASEASFTIANHLRRVEWRLRNLMSIDDSSGIHREAARFIRDDLTKTWNNIVAFVHKQVREMGLSLDKTIARSDRCLSPSDFGFHNAILTEGNRMRFTDFEYAGWDDPTKLICDFFCQPAVPVPLNYYDMFAEAVVSDLSQSQMYLHRARVLLPVYRLKWCCILLNDFLPVGGERRNFANESANQDEQKTGQLQKARNALRQLDA